MRLEEHDGQEQQKEWVERAKMEQGHHADGGELRNNCRIHAARRFVRVDVVVPEVCKHEHLMQRYQ